MISSVQLIVVCLICWASTAIASSTPPGCPVGFEVDEDAKLSSYDKVARSVFQADAKQFLDLAGKAWPIAVGAIVDSGGRMWSTGVLVSKTHVLLTAHGFAGTASLQGAVVALGYAFVSASTGDSDSGVPSTLPAVTCFELNSADVVASTRGHLDYLLVALTGPMLPSTLGYSPLAVSKPAHLLVDTPIYLLGILKDRKYTAPVAVAPTGAAPLNEEAVPVAFNKRYVQGLALVGGGALKAYRRYTKDAGTSKSVDYVITSEPGHSGAPILDERGRWFAMHQRNLNSAKCETHTPWHPYLSEYYDDTFAGPSVGARNRAVCVGEYSPSNALPRQGTSLLDIAADVREKVGSAWMCANVPQLLALLQQERHEMAVCTSKEYVGARARIAAE